MNNITILALGTTALQMALKLNGEITWGYTWIMAPLWISLAVVTLTFCSVSIIIIRKGIKLCDKSQPLSSEP